MESSDDDFEVKTGSNGGSQQDNTMNPSNTCGLQGLDDSSDDDGEESEFDGFDKEDEGNDGSDFDEESAAATSKKKQETKLPPPAPPQKKTKTETPQKKAASSGAKNKEAPSIKGGVKAGSASSTPSSTPQSSAAKKRPSNKSKTQPAAKKAAAPKDPKGITLKYMNEQNRPYSVINVYDNLHKSIPKGMLQKLLDELARDGDLVCKEYGKAKIYHANQDRLGAGEDNGPAALQALDAEARALREELQALTEAAREVGARAARLAGEPAGDALVGALADLEARNEGKEKRVAEITGSTKSVAPDAKQNICKQFNKYRGLWADRKRKATDFIGNLADGLEKKPKQVEEMIGIETDSDAGCSLPEKIKI